MTTINQKSLDARARRVATSNGYVIKKARQYVPPEMYGGFAIFDPDTNVPVCGWSYDLSAQDVIDSFRN